jgi:hypothetical protein
MNRKQPARTKAKENVAELMRESLLKKLNTSFEVFDSVSVKINDSITVYLWIVLPETEIEGIIAAYKYDSGILSIIDINSEIFNDSGIKEMRDNHELVKTSRKIFLRSSYGQSAQVINETYFNFDITGVYVDSIVLIYKSFDADRLMITSHILDRSIIGKIRLTDFFDDIWKKYESKKKINHNEY